ncbi:MAG: protein kinase, partial [Planctomycetota bacterium]|nr:protein kinase [Planctomycetota bacterium]
MAPPPDDTSERPDGSAEGSLGNRSTGADLESAASEGLRSLGDQSTTGDMGSSVSDLDDLDVGLDDDLEMVDLEARYEIQDRLGRGGMGEVFRAADRRLGRDVAIKRLRGELGTSRQAAERFLTEAKSIAVLNHFNIVQIFDYGRAADGPFIVMEYVGGGSLAETLAKGRLEQSTAVELIDQLCQALTVTHAQGVVHRDIKPANVLMTRDGVPKLTDFGLARQESVDGGQTRAGAVMGTLDYMPPEQRVDAAKADSRSDLWSLAATFYQLLTGEVPRGLIRPDRLPAELTPVLFKALEQDPSARYQTAEAFREAIHAAEASRPQTTDGGVTIGECSSCGHVSDGETKFCESCGESLLVPCYSCQADIKPWATFCGECGNNIPELLEHRLEELQDQQQQVQALRGEYRHGEALGLLEEITAETHPRFAPIREWAQDREPGLRSERQALEERRDAADRAAKAASASHEYEEVIRLLESLPSTMLSESSSHLLADAKQKDERSRELYGTIRTSVKEKRKEGLLEQVEEYLALKPGDERVLKLRDQLARRESRQRLEELATQIRQQVADKQQDGLLPLVEEFLELRPDDERMQRLAGTLQPREERSRRQAVTASRQRKRGRLKVAIGSVSSVLLLIVIGVAWNAWQNAWQEAAVQKTASLLETIPAQSVDEGQTLSVSVRVADGTRFVDGVAYELGSREILKGCTLDARSGVLDWTPGETDGGTELQITVWAKFADQPELDNKQTFTVTVKEVNSPPVVDSIPDQEVERGKPFRLRVMASDSDLPANQLRYQLVGPLPSGSSLDDVTGEFTWTPDETVQLGPREFSLRVSDDGSP